MNRVINKHQNNNTIFAKKLLVLITGYLISKICYSKIYHFLKVYKEPYMNKAILTLPHSRAIYSASIRKDLIGCAQTGTGKQQHLPYLLYINCTVL
jgi:hypothetical protein